MALWVWLVTAPLWAPFALIALAVVLSLVVVALVVVLELIFGGIHD